MSGSGSPWVRRHTHSIAAYETRTSLDRHALNGTEDDLFGPIKQHDEFAESNPSLQDSN